MYETLGKLYYKNPKHYEKIYKDRFNSEASVKLNFEIKRHPAFFLYIPEIVSLIVQIKDLNKELILVKSKLSNSAISFLTDKFLIEEILLTNDIEGVVSTKAEIQETFDFIKNKIKTEKSLLRFEGLVKKYYKLEDQLKLNELKDLRILYNEIVLPEIDKEDHPDGKLFRKGSVSVYSPTHKVLHEGTFGENKINNELKQALSILNTESLPLLIRIAIFHYLIAYIHPFYDGNGRLDRFISSSLLDNEIDRLACYRLSYAIKMDLKKYYKAFDECNNENNKGDITPFILSFLNFIKSSLEDSLSISNELEQKLFILKNKIKSSPFKTKKETINLLIILIENALLNLEGISLSELSELTGKGKTTVKRYLDEVEDYFGKESLKIDKKHREYRYKLNDTILKQIKCTPCQGQLDSS